MKIYSELFGQWWDSFSDEERLARKWRTAERYDSLAACTQMKGHINNVQGLDRKTAVMLEAGIYEPQEDLCIPQ